ncbi:hypothetical protein PVAND_003518 [Polypedilum vanderplanki]|uniref:Uncharacterized protein n=1 Tax=Polypedilum vanderplanki TaxID=319348 RepID=A0A9J6BUA8_POLVA|nr:hypothetical protein PVAND_003518 [Polypedilum vanderplanki]
MYKNYRDRPKSPDVNYFKVVPNSDYNTNIHGKKSENPLLRATELDKIDKEKEANNLYNIYTDKHFKNISTLADRLAFAGYGILISKISIVEISPMNKNSPIVRSKINYGEYKKMQTKRKIEEEEERLRQLDDAYWGTDNPEDLEPIKKQRFNNHYQSENNKKNTSSDWSDDEIDENSQNTKEMNNDKHGDWNDTHKDQKANQKSSNVTKKLNNNDDEMW